MSSIDYTAWDDERLAEILFMAEDRVELDLARELAQRPSLVPILAQIVMDKQSWLAELPEWWAVVHASYVLGLHGGEEVAVPMLTALRWADAFDCDWVTEYLPSIFGSLGPAAIPGLTQVVHDLAAGWSARDIALKGLASIGLKHPDSAEHVFKVIGARFMDEGEDRLVRQLAGHILLDFRRQDYRMALLKFAREELMLGDVESWYPVGFAPEDVEWAFKQGSAEIWHYQDDWMAFYQPAEIQRRQKRWARERLGTGRAAAERRRPGTGGQLVQLFHRQPTPDSPGDHDPEGKS